MTNQELYSKIEEIGIIPAVRVPSADDALFAAETVFECGIPIAEVTMTTPTAIGVIAQLVRDHPNKIVGAGTVLDIETAQACMEGGANFLTTTGLDPELVEFARKHDIPMIPGALTPGEVMMAKKAGAPFIKIFPCANLGGPSYIRAIRRPFPGVRLVPAGGVTQQTAEEYIRAGACALGIGHDLLPQEAIRTRNAQWIRELAGRFIGMVKQARKDSAHIHTHAH
jgi:2-dehydro-3-deoxyphosphogluconate aldolase / (4S)-4-hydroxy-2-oxoglutarate aldolase